MRELKVMWTETVLRGLEFYEELEEETRRLVGVRLKAHFEYMKLKTDAPKKTDIFAECMTFFIKQANETRTACLHPHLMENALPFADATDRNTKAARKAALEVYDQIYNTTYDRFILGRHGDFQLEKA